MSAEAGKTDQSMIFILVMGILAGCSLIFLIYQYQNYKSIAKGVENGLIQLPQIYELDRLIKERQSDQPVNVVPLDEVPDPSSLINFFTSKVFDSRNLGNLKSQCVFNIMPSVKISGNETEENISIAFKRISRIDLVNYVFYVEKAQSFIKLKEVEFKAPQKQKEDLWEAKLVFAYRRLKK